jgi:hypothetical protein
MAEMIAPDQPCPGRGGTLYRLAVPPEGITDGEPVPGKVGRCSGGCEPIDGVAGAIAAPHRR